MEHHILQIDTWQNSNIQAFWGEIVPGNHLVQIYENDNYFMATLEGFAGCGLIAGDSVIIIATQVHLDELNARLRRQGFNLDLFIANEQYFPLNAEEVLSSFTVDRWPDQHLFNERMSKLLARARQKNRKVRAFGEMVALLLAQNRCDAMIRLEELWHELHEKNPFTLFCAYPKFTVMRNVNEAFENICRAHTIVIDGKTHPSTEIHYRALG